MSKKTKNKTLPPKRASQMSTNRSRLLKAPRIPVQLRNVEDFRTPSFPLTRARAYRLMTSQPIRPISTPYKNLYPRVSAFSRMADVLPKQAVVCVKRSIRKEVIFASGHGGSRKKQRPHRRNETSKIHCRK